MSKKVHQVNKKLQKAKSPAAALAILQKLRQTNPDLYAKVQNQPGN